MEKFSFSRALIEWYHGNRRELPWRETTDPYLIWISEIILQQTRVAQGLDYFIRFTERFPDVRALAAAEEDEVLKYWQGLGYYSRARNLHTAAKEVVAKFGGEFPKVYHEILSLKGIGEYTAAAVCSFAWRQSYAVVDGNVYRVLSRYFGIDMPIDTGKGKKLFSGLARELLDCERPDVYNQAIMDFGAVQCVPKSPNCPVCPLSGNCVAYHTGQVPALPVKGSKTIVKPRYFNYLHIHCKGNTLLVRREAKDIWRNLFEFPLIESDCPVDFVELQQNENFRRLFTGVSEMSVRQIVEMPKHVLSHRVIYARFYDVEVLSFSPEMKKYLIIAEDQLEKYAISRLTELYLER